MRLFDFSVLLFKCNIVTFMNNYFSYTGPNEEHSTNREDIETLHFIFAIWPDWIFDENDSIRTRNMWAFE